MKDVLALTDYIKGHLKTVADGHIDSGLGLGSSDLWVTIEGKEFFITIKESQKNAPQDD